MQQSINKFSQTLALLMFTVPAIAHDGHDHSHWASGLLHLMFYGSVLAVGTGIFFAAYKAYGRSDQTKMGE